MRFKLPKKKRSGQVKAIIQTEHFQTEDAAQYSIGLLIFNGKKLQIFYPHNVRFAGFISA